jgi:hypothetical protein
MNDQPSTSMAGLRSLTNDTWACEACLVVFSFVAVLNLFSCCYCFMEIQEATESVVLTTSPSVTCAVDHHPVFDQYGKLEIVRGYAAGWERGRGRGRGRG